MIIEPGGCRQQAFIVIEGSANEITESGLIDYVANRFHRPEIPMEIGVSVKQKAF